MIKITIKSLNIESLSLYKVFLKQIFTKLKIKYSIISLPIKIKKITVLKSPHVNKAAREQFLIKKHKKVFYIFSNINNINTKFLILNKPKTTKILISKIRK